MIFWFCWGFFKPCSHQESKEEHLRFLLLLFRVFSEVSLQRLPPVLLFKVRGAGDRTLPAAGNTTLPVQINSNTRFLVPENLHQEFRKQMALSRRHLWLYQGILESERPVNFM